MGKYCKRKSTFCAGDLIVRVLKQPTTTTAKKSGDGGTNRLPVTSKVSQLAHLKKKKNKTGIGQARFQSMPSLQLTEEKTTLHGTLSDPTKTTSRSHQHHARMQFRERDKHENMSHHHHHHHRPNSSSSSSSNGSEV